MTHWSHQAIIYHLFPLGACGCPQTNDHYSPAVSRLDALYEWLSHIQDLGCNALLLGPVFESSNHGYDTADYYSVDRRLGDNAAMVNFSQTLHAKGLRLILDGVLNHVGRDFWAFRDVLEHGESSRYRDWFSNLQFGKPSPYHDPFSYEGWNGHYSLVKLNLNNPEVTAHLFDAVRMWIREFQIDGLRLDAADCLPFEFMQELASVCRAIKPDFWLMGEVVHGDYREWANSATLDSTTNYELYKSLYSSHNDQNYFELAYALNRQSGENGIYKDLFLYNFIDNHDVSRIYSLLNQPGNIYPLLTLLFTVPGIPSIYYGSEGGVEGMKGASGDWNLRPRLDLVNIQEQGHRLITYLRTLSRIRSEHTALQSGGYRQVYLSHNQFGFARFNSDETIIICVNSDQTPAIMEIDLAWSNGKALQDLRDPEWCITFGSGKCSLKLEENSSRVLVITDKCTKE